MCRCVLEVFCFFPSRNNFKLDHCFACLWGKKDSKALTSNQREEIFDRLNKLNDFCGYAIKALSPNTISNSMLKREKYNLNEISHDTAIHLIDEIRNKHKLNVNSVYVDTVGDPNKYQLKLQARFPEIPKIKVSAKADSLFPCVSASSICAKVIRDSLLHNWKFLENIQETTYGSGYPGGKNRLEYGNLTLFDKPQRILMAFFLRSSNMQIFK
jgi:ribonuclease H2 subunit A